MIRALAFAVVCCWSSACAKHVDNVGTQAPDGAASAASDAGADTSSTVLPDAATDAAVHPTDDAATPTCSPPSTTVNCFPGEVPNDCDAYPGTVCQLTSFTCVCGCVAPPSAVFCMTDADCGNYPGTACSPPGSGLGFCSCP